MTHDAATMPWPAVPGSALRTTTRFSTQAPGAAGRVSGLATTILRPDGSGDLWLELPNGVSQLAIAAGEPFGSVIERISGALLQASYPMNDTNPTE